MYHLLIESTKSSPSIDYIDDNRMIIKGRSMPVNAENFYTPLIEWANSYDFPFLVLDIDLQYMNSASVKKILELLKILDKKVMEFSVNWYFEEADSDTLENGHIFEESLKKAKFFFHEYSDAA